nr:cation-translocating P-type ATPase [Atopobacter phocae]
MQEVAKEERLAYHTMPEDDVLSKLNTSMEGLSEREVGTRRDIHGENVLEAKKQKTTLQKFLNQFKDFMIIILLIAAGVSAVLGEVTDGIIILLVVLLNALLGVFQENKAEEAINALKKMASPMAKVKRDGHTLEVKSEEIVPGDIILLEAGDIVPADVRLIESNSLKVEEAALTGESVPVEKHVGTLEDGNVSIGDRTNMLYSSTSITYGRAVGVVTETGMNTEVGKIANLLNTTEEKKTPLQENQDALGRWLTIAIIIIAAIIFVIGFIKEGDLLRMLLTAISIAVAAIPEGLPAITTIILALGTQKMAKRHALVRKLPAVETLGGTEVICSDKTGTLTLNQMTVEKIVFNQQVINQDQVSADQDLLFKIMSFANDTKINQAGELLGDPTETALVQFSLDHSFDLNEALSQEPRMEELPFDSTRKMMSTIHQSDSGYFIAVKGAPDMLLARCQSILINGKEQPLTAVDSTQLTELNHQLATQALRVLALAYKRVDQLPSDLTSETIEEDLVFAGLVGMIDPEREEAKDAIRVAKDAGIRTVMITGDHKDTATAIAQRLGILEPHQTSGVMTGAELDHMSDEQLEKQVQDYSVYARVSPEHKVRIVKAWQANNKVVAMTGDGVNDAPSLKTADIGIGMGITGTEVSKGASDMVLADDNFQTIVVAVEEGRKVFSNIQKAVQYLLSANLGEVLTMFIATMLGWQILEPIHILWINLVTDVFPAIALGLEDADDEIMQQPPRGKSSNFLSNGVLLSIIYQGILEGGLTLYMYWYVTHIKGASIPTAETMAFATLGLIQLFHAFNVKSVFKSLFTTKPFSNKGFNYAILVSGFMLLFVIVVPGVQDFFNSTPLSLIEWLEVWLTAFAIVPIVEIIKLGLRLGGVDKKVLNMKNFD